MVRSSSGIDALDDHLTGRTVEITGTGVDADGAPYVVLEEGTVFAYLDQLELRDVDPPDSHRSRRR